MILNLTPDVPSDPRIVGFWKGINGDYDLINEFREDGTVVQHVGDRSSRPKRYRIEGNEIVYLIEQPDRTIYEERKRYSISGNQLTFFYANQEMHFLRIEDR